MPDTQDIVKAAVEGEGKKGEDDQASAQTDDLNKRIEKDLKDGSERSEREIRDFYDEWKRSIELRLGKTVSLYTGGASQPDGSVRNEANPDWPLTKMKTANLFSQVPTVRVTHRNLKVMAALSPFEKSLNYELGETRARARVCMKEAVNDVVNASGVAMIRVEYAARFEDKLQPAKGVNVPPGVPEELLNQMMEAGEIESEVVPSPTDSRFTLSRRTPTDILYALNFKGSDFDDADWVGERGVMPWSVAKPDFKLDDSDKDVLTKQVIPQGQNQTDLRSGGEKSDTLSAPSIRYKELFYLRYRYDEDCKNFNEIWRIVFVEGKKAAVVHEQWKGQQYDPKTKKLIGARRYPLRFLTLTYVSDNPIPPSDSSVARPSVNDMRNSRSQIFQNRQFSLPWRWFNTNLVDPMNWDNMMKGRIQGAIPVNGSGERAFGEIARASYPPEDLEFDRTVRQDLNDSWFGMNQMGNGGGRRTKAEAELVQQNYATVMGQERDAVAFFFLGMCDVLAGLMVLYSDWPVLDDEEKQRMFSTWGGKHVLHDVVFKIRPDSTIVLDVPQRLQRLERYINITAKSGMVDELLVLMEYTELSGFDDVSKIVHPPMPKPPEEPTVSLRFTGKEDLTNAGVMAMLVQTKKAPTPQAIAQAYEILAMLQKPELAQQAVAAAAAQAQQQGPPGATPPVPGGPATGRLPPGGAGAHPEWTLNDKIMKRNRDAS